MTQSTQTFDPSHTTTTTTTKPTKAPIPTTPSQPPPTPQIPTTSPRTESLLQKSRAARRLLSDISSTPCETLTTSDAQNPGFAAEIKEPCPRDTRVRRVRFLGVCAVIVYDVTSGEFVNTFSESLDTSCETKPIDAMLTWGVSDTDDDDGDDDDGDDDDGDDDDEEKQLLEF